MHPRRIPGPPAWTVLRPDLRPADRILKAGFRQPSEPPRNPDQDAGSSTGLRAAGR